jgi:hypothetical protein
MFCNLLQVEQPLQLSHFVLHWTFLFTKIVDSYRWF